MIIQCESCSRKFLVKDVDIPQEGRMVQCGNCSQKWFQMPFDQSNVESKQDIEKDFSSEAADNETIIKENIIGKKIKASDGKTYQFLGMQWAELLPSGKIGMLAKKAISLELNNISSTNTSKVIDPSSEIEDHKKRKKEYNDDETKQGLGFFGYLFLLLIILISLIGIAKTFEKEFLIYLPQSEYIFETLENMFTVIKDLIKSY